MSSSGSENARAAEVALILTTLPDPSSAEKLVTTLIDERLIACGNILPAIVSVYRWEGDVSRESEVLVMMKTVSDLVEGLFQRIGELHPYAVPEMVEVPVDRVASSYFRWIVESTRVNA